MCAVHWQVNQSSMISGVNSLTGFVDPSKLCVQHGVTSSLYVTNINETDQRLVEVRCGGWLWHGAWTAATKAADCGLYTIEAVQAGVLCRSSSTCVPIHLLLISTECCTTASITSSRLGYCVGAHPLAGVLCRSSSTCVPIQRKRCPASPEPRVSYNDADAETYRTPVGSRLNLQLPPVTQRPLYDERP
ncbi:hypothetical protein J6590_003497 [Homalodisca vitripennis]|nr:hypothetical protein J6590_091300 [Homalodisca vitripennis]KAG8289159.1 hypothetical protein J6590_003497 [Homalodisca vitripennis]